MFKLESLTQHQAFGVGFVSGAVIGGLGTYFLTRPSKKDKKAAKKLKQVKKLLKSGDLKSAVAAVEGQKKGDKN